MARKGNVKWGRFLKIAGVVVAAVMVALICVIGIICLPIALIYYSSEYEVVTDVGQYQNVIGASAKNQYGEKCGINEGIFPEKLDGLDVKDFRMTYNRIIDREYFAYLVIDYDEDRYDDEIERLNNYEAENAVDYDLMELANYELLAIESDSYQSLVYAMADGGGKIVYVEMVFCNPLEDIEYETIPIPQEYLLKSSN